MTLQSDSHLWHKTNKLEEERRLFFQQKENFESERQKFMEAVHELDREVFNDVLEDTILPIIHSFILSEVYF